MELGFKLLDQIAIFLTTPVTFGHLFWLFVAMLIGAKLTGLGRKPKLLRINRNSREPINRATYNPKQYRGRTKQERNW